MKSKSAKRFLSLLLCAMLCLSTLMISTLSASASSGDIIYFEKPADWDDTIYIYYWEGSPKPANLYDYQMENIGGNIYKYVCKASFSEFLFDDGQSGKHQTVNVKLPASGKMCRVLSTGKTNDWGNFCNNAEWVDFEQPSIGLAVSASPKSCDFVNSLEVALSVSEAVNGTYKINGGDPVTYTDGTKITIGEEAQVGDVITLELSASADGETASETYTYTKASTPAASSLVYFDNSAYNWEDVYIYAYGTKENAKWPGEKMQKDESGLYYCAFTSAYKSENVIFNNGKEKDEGKEQFPQNSGLPIKTGECKLLTSENEWVDYGTPDSKPAGFAYTASGTAFSDDSINVKIGLKNAVKGTYQIDGGSAFEYTGETIVPVGLGKIGNSTVKLTLTATSDKGVTTSKDYFYKKTFTSSKTTFSSPSDGHTTESINGKYGTNPNMQLGKNKTITVDGNPSEWDSSMIIAQGVANDDPRVYMPSSMHEQPWDDYALYAAWDDDNLYFMWEMANTTYVVSPSDNFAASQEARPWRNSIPMYLALSVNPSIHADGTAWGTDKSGNAYTNPFVWGCDGGVAKDGGVKFKTNIDTLIAFDTNNSNGGASIFKADHYDEATDNYMFNYDTRIPIGVTSYEKQDNQNGFKIAKDYGTLSDTMIGVGGAKGSHTIGDSLKAESNWVDFFDLGYKNSHGFIYEVSIPLEKLGIDKVYIEQNGIGAMQILTYGTSGMDCLPYDATMQDNADVEYSYDPSTSHEKEDIDEITVPLARVGALLSDTVITEAPFEVNFGTDKAGVQSVNTPITLKAEAYNGDENYNYNFSVNDTSVQNSSADSCVWTPSEQGEYKISVEASDGKGKQALVEKTISIGDMAPEIPTTPTQPGTPTTPTTPTQPSTPTTPTTPTQPSTPTTPTTPTQPSTPTTPTTPTQPSTPTTPTTPTQPSTPTPPAPKLMKTSVSLKAGAKSSIIILNAGGSKVTYTSANSKIATVKKGLVTALRKGTTKITVKVGAKKLIYTVKVTTSPKLSASSITLKKNQSRYVTISGKASSVKNKYKNTKYAKFVSKVTASKIKVKGLRKGTTTLKVIVNGVTLKLKVKVK